MRGKLNFFNSKLSEIEKEIIKNQQKIDNIDYSISVNGINVEENYLSGEQITKELNKDNNLLEIKRQFILSRRNGWKQRLFWSMIIPIIITIITNFLIKLFL